ncbi:patatin-like phospholipase family protein [Barnesiella sp. An55]|uniref:patatin-like phospholipase family protein n=1 Tax=Barnesiella sp. An55 TaxID=1965646 RepID=UPI000B3A13EB|nr:patatin-like phospholipase family protein [Barnesiella sp. An55]OUN73772.1 patatin [Barnesiella sp. An55]HIZ26406.1 patatin-like phospholipase family protein [Candidatus Barnesiella merdipullorum]
MKRIWMLLLVSLCVWTHLPAQTVGLVLSGGGAKGIAHIGIIKALEENNVPIDYVAGTSMGAIVGAWYAMGYTPDEMLDLILSDDFSLWSRGIFDERYVYYFKKPDPSPEIVSFNVALQDSSKFEPHFLPNSLINPFPMNYAFMSLFAPYSAQCEGDFDKLFIPFRAVASDVYHKREVVLRDGDLGDAVRASMSFPFVFKPIEIDSVLVYDGGIYNNFPVDVMKSDFNPDIIIGSIVAAKIDKPKEDDLINQIENMVMQKSDYTLDPEDGILMRFNLSDVGLLDFPKARQIAKIGYDYAMELMDSIKSRIPRELSQETRQLQRMVFKSQTPDLVFNSVSVEGGNHQQQEYIKRQFDSDETFTDEDAKAAYYKTISDGKISDLIPHARYDKATGMFNLDIKAKVHDQLAVGMGGFISSTSSNQICIGAHYRTVSLNSLDLDLTGQIGQSYTSGIFSARFDLKTAIPMYLKMQAVASKQKFYQNETLFYSDRMPSFITQSEQYVKFRLGLPFLTSSKAVVSVGYGSMTDKYYQSNTVDFSSNEQDRSRYNLFMASMKFDRNNLNSYMYPTAGTDCSVLGLLAYGKERFSPYDTSLQTGRTQTLSWLQLEGNIHTYIPFGNKFVLGLRGKAVVSSKGLLSNYTSTLAQAPAFTPTPHSQTIFNPAFRSTQYLAAGVIPIWKILNNLQFRNEFYLFAPFRQIYEGPNYEPYYGKAFTKYHFMGESSVVLNLSFASISLYANYYDYPARNWNFGINIGLLVFSPRFLE